MYFQTTATNVPSHPIIAEVGRKAVHAVREYSEESNDRRVFWKCKSRDGIELAAGCLQVFSDKSHFNQKLQPPFGYTRKKPFTKVLNPALKRQEMRIGLAGK